MQIGRYRIEGELGRGGMGVVHRAYDPELDRGVAIKVLTDLDPGMRLRFQREAEAAASVRHPNLVTVHGCGVDERGAPYLVLDLVEGGSLDQRLKTGGPLPEAEAIEVVEAVARALHTVHEAGVVHRDLKPANVLVDAESRPRLTDFGLARRVDLTSVGLTATGEVLGTPTHMAPEQVRGEEVGPATDVHGLGALLFHLLTDRPPPCCLGPSSRSSPRSSTTRRRPPPACARA